MDSPNAGTPLRSTRARSKEAKLARLRDIEDAYDVCRGRYYQGLSQLEDAERRLVSLELQMKGEDLMRQLAKRKRSGAQMAMRQEERAMGELLEERRFLEREVGAAVLDWGGC